MAFLIDTNIAIYAVDGVASVLNHFERHQGAVVLSAVSLVELQRGIYKSSEQSGVRRNRLAKVLEHIPVIPFDAAAAEAYGRIIAQCGWVKGRDFDMMIAAHAISSSSVLVTNNAADFRDVPGLMVENWV